MAAFRVVLDTSVVLAAHRTENLRSPNLEVLDRWGRREFALLYSDEVLVEYAEKLTEHGISDGDVLNLEFGRHVRCATFLPKVFT